MMVTTPGATDASPGDGLFPRSDNAGAVRDPDLVLAHVHLVLGSLGLARAELETMAGQGTLDDEAIRDLAEARWRTGDLAGAGDAATAWLETHPDDILGLVIAAEARSALGRPGEARRLAGRAIERANGSLDPVFAGMQRSPIWPVEVETAAGSVGVLFDELHPGPFPVRERPSDSDDYGRPRPLGEQQAPADVSRAGAPKQPPAGASLWGDAADVPVDGVDQLEPGELFHRSRAALDGGRPADAAAGLILALRASPGLAPAILDLLVGRGEPILALIRGDAERIVGREVEAMRDHASAAAGLTGPAESSDLPDELAEGAEPDGPAGPDSTLEPTSGALAASDLTDDQPTIDQENP